MHDGEPGPPRAGASAPGAGRSVATALVVVLAAGLVVAALALLPSGERAAERPAEPARATGTVGRADPPPAPPAREPAEPAPAPATPRGSDEAPPPASPAGAEPLRAPDPGPDPAAAPPAPPRPPDAPEPAPEPEPTAPAPPPAPEPAPAPPAPAFPEGAFGVWVRGADAEPAARAAQPALDVPRADDARPVVLLAAEAEPAGARAAVEVEGGALVLRSAAPPDDPVDDRVDAVSALRVAGAALSDVRLTATEAERGPALAALAALAAGDAPLAEASAAGFPPERSPGARVLAAYAALARGRLDAVHAEVGSLLADADVGPVARFLVGAALLADGNSAEARRDFVAAARDRPSLWPARLFQGFAEHRLGLDREALASYEAVLAAAPGRVEAALGRAVVASGTDREGALEALRGLVARRPREAAAWAWIATLQEGVEDDAAAAEQVTALERVTDLRPADATAWSRLGTARFRLHERGGGASALAAAVNAYRRHAELAPDLGVAWFNLGAALHRLATTRTPGARDVSAVRARLAEAADAYRRALPGLYGADAAGALYNLAIVEQLLGRLPAAREALDAATAADASFPLAATERVALAVAERDPRAAQAAIGRLPAGADAGDRALLAASVAALDGRDAEVRAYLATAGEKAEKDLLTPLARLLMVQGWPAAGRALLSADTSDPTRLTWRIRAAVRLYDDAAARRDLAALERSDPAAAKRLRETDPDVRDLPAQ